MAEQVQVPGPVTKELLARREAAVPRAVFNTMPIFVAANESAAVIDVEGDRYIDFAGGLGVMNVGRGNPKVIAAIHEQADRFVHECFHTAMYEGYVELAEKLNEVTPGDHAKKTMLANSGAEAVENAVKIARYATERPDVITFSNAFHGRTLLGMTLTAKQSPYRKGFPTHAPNVHRVPYAYCYRCPFKLEPSSCGMACVEHVADVIDSELGREEVACMIVEPVQGEGGFIVPPHDFLPALKAVCTERDIVFITDEIQTGMGRTGKLFASEHFGVVPDILTTAKSLAAGMPLSGIVGRADLMEAPHVGALGGTYGGNPIACAAALAVISELTETDLLERAEKQARIVRERLDPVAERLGIVGEIRGLGPMIGLELVTDEASKEPNKVATAGIVARCFGEGLLILKAGTYDNVIRLLTPLVISEEELHAGLDILVAALEWADSGMN